jgi:uncharacterized membrane protein
MTASVANEDYNRLCHHCKTARRFFASRDLLTIDGALALLHATNDALIGQPAKSFGVKTRSMTFHSP